MIDSLTEGRTSALDDNEDVAGDLTERHEATQHSTTPTDTERSVHFQVGMTFAEIEREMLLKTLAYYHNNKPKTAQALGISLKTLYNRLARSNARPTTAFASENKTAIGSGRFLQQSNLNNMSPMR